MVYPGEDGAGVGTVLHHAEWLAQPMGVPGRLLGRCFNFRFNTNADIGRSGHGRMH